MSATSAENRAWAIAEDLASSAGWSLGPLLWIWWQGRLRFVPPHPHERLILIVHGRAECGISLGIDESTAWGFEQGEVQVGMGSEGQRMYAEISQRRQTVQCYSSHKDSG